MGEAFRKHHLNQWERGPERSCRVNTQRGVNQRSKDVTETLTTTKAESPTVVTLAWHAPVSVNTKNLNSIRGTAF